MNRNCGSVVRLALVIRASKSMNLPVATAMHVENDMLCRGTPFRHEPFAGNLHFPVGDCGVFNCNSGCFSTNASCFTIKHPFEPVVPFFGLRKLGHEPFEVFA